MDVPNSGTSLRQSNLWVIRFQPYRKPTKNKVTRAFNGRTSGKMLELNRTGSLAGRSSQRFPVEANTNMDNNLPKVLMPELVQACQNREHWIEMLLFGECKVCESHVCANDEWATGKCLHQSHDYELIDQRPASDSQNYLTAHS